MPSVSRSADCPAQDATRVFPTCTAIRTANAAAPTTRDHTPYLAPCRAHRLALTRPLLAKAWLTRLTSERRAPPDRRPRPELPTSPPSASPLSTERRASASVPSLSPAVEASTSSASMYEGGGWSKSPAEDPCSSSIDDPGAPRSRRSLPSGVRSSSGSASHVSGGRGEGGMPSGGVPTEEGVPSPSQGRAGPSRIRRRRAACGFKPGGALTAGR